jgi:hypothetical protein
MERDVWMVEHGQQFGLVGVQPLQQAIQTDEAGVATEDVVEPRAELVAPPWCRRGAVVLQIGVKLPNQRADLLLCGTLLVGEGVEFVHQPLGVYPTECVLTDGKLSGVVTDNHPLTQKVMRLDAAPQRPLGGDLHRVGCYRQRGDPKLLQMRLPGRRIGKLLVRVFRQASDDGSGERTLAHVAQCHIIDHVIGISGAQQIEEVPAALAIGRAEPGKVFVADLGAKAVGGFMSRPSVVGDVPASVETFLAALPALSR